MDFVPPINLTPPMPAIPRAGPVQGEGLCFQVSGSAYRDVRLCSAEPVSVSLESIPKVVSFTVRGLTGVGETSITLGGLEPGRTYYRYEDGHRSEVFVAEAAGSHTYVQDLSRPHQVFLKERPSTKYIRDDANGGDCASIGSWDPATKTCLLTTDVSETIILDADGLTLDGGGHSVTASGFAIYAPSHTDLTIQNVVVSGSPYGIYLFGSPASRVSGNTVSMAHPGDYGIRMESSAGSTVSDNTLFSADSAYYGLGILIYSSPSSEVRGNEVAVAYGGIGIALSFSAAIITGV